MAIGAQVTIGIRAGYATSSQVPIVACSLYPGDITLTVSGKSPITQTPTAIGTGRPTSVTFNGGSTTTAGYVTAFTQTGLLPFTRYLYTVSQVQAGGITQTETGSFMTAPAATDDFAFFFAGCDNNSSYQNAANIATGQDGFWPLYQAYAQGAGNLPVVGVLFVDDFGYVDMSRIDDQYGTGHTQTSIGASAYEHGRDYDYALGWLANYGLFEDVDTSALKAYNQFGRASGRVWCTQNLNVWPQWGDHEFANDLGTDYPSDWAGVVPSIQGRNASTATGAALFTVGKTMWDAFMKPLQPPSIGVIDVAGTQTPANTGAHPTTGANHWGFQLGNINIVAMDGYTHANGQYHGDGTSYSDGSGHTLSGAQPTVLFGSNQIKDTLNWLNGNPAAFNIFGMGYGIRYLSTPHSVTNAGSQGPLFDNILPEYQQIFTATGNTPKSIMDNDRLNGVNGMTVCLHGDYHRSMVVKYHAPAYSGNAAELFYSIYNGTTNGSQNFAVDSSVVTGYDYNSTTFIEYLSNWVGTAVNGHSYAGIRVEHYGSASPPQLKAVLMDLNGNTVWTKTWTANSNTGSVATGSLETGRASVIIAVPDWSDAATITASDAISAGPVTNLQKMQPTDVWQTAGLSSVYIECDRGSSQPINLVSLLYTNATADAVWRIRMANSQAELITAPIYDGPLVGGPAAVGYLLNEDGSYVLNEDGSKIILDDGGGASIGGGATTLWASATLDTRRHAFAWLPNTISARWVRIDVSDPANSEGCFRAGRLYISNAWQPTRNVQYGVSIGFIDPSKKDRTTGSQTLITPRPKIPVAKFNLAFLSEDEMLDNEYELQRTRGASSDLLIVFDPNQDTHRHKKIFYGLGDGGNRITNTNFNLFEVNYEVEALL